jgi:hypothetical protein
MHSGEQQGEFWASFRREGVKTIFIVVLSYIFFAFYAVLICTYGTEAVGGESAGRLEAGTPTVLVAFVYTGMNCQHWKPKKTFISLRNFFCPGAGGSHL